MIGSGILKGLAVTAKNFVGSFHDEKRYVTVAYPEEKAPVTEAFRNFPFLVHDAENDPMGTLRCVACKICEKECPPQCIYIVQDRDEKGKPRKHPKIFDIDISVCMSCQICVEVCPFDAIKMDQVFEIAQADRFDGLLLKKNDLAKPNTYYHTIHPAEASEVDARLAEEKRIAEEKAKAAAAAKEAAAAKAAAAAAAKAAAPVATSAPATPAPASAPAAKPAATPPASNSAPAPAADAPKPPPPAAT